jgi:hypothetical protein
MDLTPALAVNDGGDVALPNLQQLNILPPHPTKKPLREFGRIASENAGKNPDDS